MKFFLIILFSLATSNIFAVDFKNFDEYKKNDALLTSDIERLESLNGQNHDQLYADTINQYRLLLLNYERINSPLSLEAFVTDATENGWIATATKSQNLVSVCEGHEIDRSKCLDELNQLKLFVSGSKLRIENKDSINSFIDNYIADSTQLAVFDEKFISSFNENSKLINLRIAPVKTAPAMTVKITPVKKVAPLLRRVVGITVEKSYWEYLYASGSLLFFISALIFYKRKKKLKSLKAFYGRIFHIARKNKMEIKFFGYMDFSGLSVIRKIEKPFLESIQYSKSLAPLAHVKFKTQKNVLKVETLFFSNRSILGFMEKEAEVLREKLENLQQAVSACGGELIYSNNFNTNGEIVNSNLTINLPMN